MPIKDLTCIKKHLFLCNGGSCKAKGAEESTAVIRRKIDENDRSGSIHTTKTLCNGRCNDGPIVISQPEGIWFKDVTPDKAAAFAADYLFKDIVPDGHRLYIYGENSISDNPKNNQSMETTRQFHYGTVLEAITILREQGYGHDFTVYDGKLKADGRFFCPDELEITDVYRYEGDTDPADEAIVFALSAQCGLKGILVAGYGADTDGSGQLIAQLHYRYLRP